MKDRNRILLLSLKKCYDKSNNPVLYIKKNFRPFYFNEKMSILFGEFCGKTTIKDYLSEKSIKLFSECSDFSYLELTANTDNYFDKFTVEPVFSGVEVICYQVLLGGFGGIGKWANVNLRNMNVPGALSETLTASLSDLYQKVESIKENASLRIYNELEDISGIINNLSAVSGSLKDTIDRISKLSSDNKTFFRLSEILSELSSVAENIVLPNEFKELDDETVVFAARGGLAEVFLRCCRYMVIEARRAVKIKMEISNRNNKVIVNFSCPISGIAAEKPFSSYFTDKGTLNYGLYDCKKFIEEQDGNLIVLNKKNNISILISLPFVDIRSLPTELFDVVYDNSFSHLLFEIDEYRDLVSSYKNK